MRTGYDTFAQHIIYLLSEIQKYPPTHPRLISDKTAHLTAGYAHYVKHVEGQIREGNLNFGVILSLQYCLSMVQLALHRSQHGEFWKSQTRQQNNFDNIKKYADQVNQVLKDIKVAVENHNCSIPTALPSTNRIIESSNSSYGNDSSDDNNDQTTTSSDDETTTIMPSTTRANHHQQDFDDDDGDDELEEGSNLNGDIYPADQGAQDLPQPNNGSESWFSWDWLTNPFGSNNTSDLNNVFSDDDSSNDDGDWKSEVYTEWRIVRLWPFASLISLALFHLLSMIDFYLNLFWKVLTLLLMVYAYVLSNRIERLQCETQRDCCGCQKGNCEQQEPVFGQLEIVTRAVNAQAKKEKFTRTDLKHNQEAGKPLVKRRGF